MQKNNMKEFLVLPIICIVTAFLVSGTYMVTKDTIENSEKVKMNTMRQQVLSDADSFHEKDYDIDNMKDSLKDAQVYIADNGAGVAIQTTVKGYGGDLTVMTGIDSGGKVAGVKVVSSNATVGLGTKAETDTFTSQFVGVDKTFVLGATTGDGTVVAVSGATISSKAMLASVNAAKEIYEQIKEAL